MRLYDADVIIKALDQALDTARKDGADAMEVLKMALFRNFMTQIISYPPIETETTSEQVREYCRKRDLVIVNCDLFNEMKARWSEATRVEPVRHGHWIFKETDYPVKDEFYICSECGSSVGYETDNYCPHCGAKMSDDCVDPEIYPCSVCPDYDRRSGCKSPGGCGASEKGDKYEP